MTNLIVQFNIDHFGLSSDIVIIVNAISVQISSHLSGRL